MDDALSERGNGVPKNSKHQWIAQEDEHLVHCLLRMINEGSWKAENGFRTGYLTQLEKWMHERIPNCEIKGNPHIESRLKTWKRQFHAISEMLGPKASGFGWNDKDKCIVCEKQIYDEWVKGHPTAKGLRNKPFPFLEELSIVFGKDRATGEASEAPADAVENIDEDETNGNISAAGNTNTTANEQNSPGNTSAESQSNIPTGGQSQPRNEETDVNRGSKRRRTVANEEHVDPATACLLSVQGMFANANDNVAKLANCFQFMQDDAARKLQVFNELLKLQSLSAEERMRAGAIICASTDKINYLFSLPDEEYKLSYVQMVLDGRIN